MGGKKGKNCLRLASFLSYRGTPERQVSSKWGEGPSRRQRSKRIWRGGVQEGERKSQGREGAWKEEDGEGGRWEVLAGPVCRSSRGKDQTGMGGGGVGWGGEGGRGRRGGVGEGGGGGGGNVVWGLGGGGLHCDVKAAMGRRRELREEGGGCRAKTAVRMNA